MKVLTTLLALALIAGVAFANLAPTLSQGDKIVAASPIQDVVEPAQLIPSQSIGCGLPYFGKCDEINFTPGNCDCDVPTATGFCEDNDGRAWQVLQCYGSIFCSIGAYCPP